MSPTNQALRKAFMEEIGALRGDLSDARESGPCLYLRSVLPREGKVKHRDGINGGVALLANEREIRVHPYTFRQICRNGAIWAQALETARIERAAWTLGDVRQAIRDCASPTAFHKALEQMQSATVTPLGEAFEMLARFASGPAVRQIMQRLLADPDRSAFGLVNAITSVARDTEDADTRWRLEELGGDICAALRRPPRKPKTSNLLLKT